jgi:methylmalonyl-CoA/ethylmalonyl-CoA epimerase
LAALNHAVGHTVVQITYPGGGKIELLEPLYPSAPSVGNFLKRQPRGGLHHITFRVKDLESALNAAERAGFGIFGVQLDHPVWREGFLQPRDTGGVLLQLAETGADFSGPAGTALDQVLAESAVIRAQHFSATDPQQKSED